MPTYDHLCKGCNKEFELEYSIKADPPTACPLCKQEGHIMRLISGATPGKVELQGSDLIQHIKTDAKRIEREASKSETKYANLLGEKRYQSLQSQIDKRKR